MCPSATTHAARGEHPDAGAVGIGLRRERHEPDQPGMTVEQAPPATRRPSGGPSRAGARRARRRGTGLRGGRPGSRRRRVAPAARAAATRAERVVVAVQRHRADRGQVPGDAGRDQDPPGPVPVVALGTREVDVGDAVDLEVDVPGNRRRRSRRTRPVPDGSGTVRPTVDRDADVAHVASVRASRARATCGGPAARSTCAAAAARSPRPGSRRPRTRCARPAGPARCRTGRSRSGTPTPRRAAPRRLSTFMPWVSETRQPEAEPEQAAEHRGAEAATGTPAVVRARRALRAHDHHRSGRDRRTRRAARAPPS